MPPNYGLKYGVFAVILGVLALHNKGWNPALRAVLSLVALVFAVTFAAWLADLLIYLTGKMRAAWFFPQVRQLEIITRMTEAQLAAVGIGVVYAGKLPVAGQLVTRYRVEGYPKDLTAEAVRDWYEYCMAWERRPFLPALHGFVDGEARDELAAFTRLVVSLNLADPARGNEPARWTASAEEIERRLEL